MKKVTNLEIGTLLYFLMKAFLVNICFNTIINIAKQDSYISIAIGFMIGLIPLIAFFFLFNYEPNSNIIDKNIKLFGKYIGYFINIILIILTFTMSSVLFINLVTFIHDEYLIKTPILIISILLIICIYYTLSKGQNSIIRGSTIFFIISISLFIICIFGLIFKIDLNNFKPVLIHNYYKGSFSFISYSVLPLYLLLLIPKKKIVNNHQTYKTITLFYLISSFTIITIILCVIGLFGINLTLLYKYPEFEVLRHVYIQGISSKINSILFIQSILDMIIFIIYGLQFCLEGMKLKDNKKNIMIFIFSIFLIILNEKLHHTLLLFNNILSSIIFITIISILILSIILLLFKDKEVSKTSSNQ